MSRQLDLRAACEAFVAVAERESFTAGASAAGVTQSVASRRVAALEHHLGARLFERSSRRVMLTPFGKGVLPSAVKLVDAAQELLDDAGRASRLPVTVGVPHGCDAAAAARLRAAVREQRMLVEFMPAAPADRAEALTNGRISLAFEAVEPDRARWSTVLGLAGAAPTASDDGIFFAELRPRRGPDTPRRIWLQPEDDVPPVRDRMERVRNGAGLLPSQLRVAGSVVAAMSEALGDDLVLCSAREASEFGLHWRALGDVHLTRGYALGARDATVADRFILAAGPLAAEMLGIGSPEPVGARVGSRAGDHAE